VIVDTVTELRPRTVVELGSGTSTFLLALLARAGTPERILSVDHDALYLGRTAERLAEAGLDDRVELVHAPLRQVTVDGVTSNWYDVDVVPTPDSVDLLLVDGPPCTFGATVRHPALGWYVDRLPPEGVVLLDDADRPGEREILRSWRADHDEFVVTVLPTEKGTAVVHRRGRRPAFLGPPVESG
jgi:predicted O-methyltransferase YrrM